MQKSLVSGLLPRQCRLQGHTATIALYLAMTGAIAAHKATSGLLMQAAIERLLVRAYVAYERLAGFGDVPDGYTGADALRGCEMLLTLIAA